MLTALLLGIIRENVAVIYRGTSIRKGTFDRENMVCVCVCFLLYCRDTSHEWLSASVIFVKPGNFFIN